MYRSEDGGKTFPGIRNSNSVRVSTFPESLFPLQMVEYMYAGVTGDGPITLAMIQKLKIRLITLTKVWL